MLIKNNNHEKTTHNHTTIPILILIPTNNNNANHIKLHTMKTSNKDKRLIIIVLYLIAIHMNTSGDDLTFKLISLIVYIIAIIITIKYFLSK